jgi:hypothetical protein
MRIIDSKAAAGARTTAAAIFFFCARGHGGRAKQKSCRRLPFPRHVAKVEQIGRSARIREGPAVAKAP